MIINSMSRKAPTFKQLVAYFDRDTEDGQEPVFARNLYHDGRNRQRVIAQFHENHQYLPARKNGNALYHELLVLPKQPHLSHARLREILIALADEYCAERAPGQLAWGQVHFNTDYPHIHLMISSNAIASPKRARLSQREYHKIQEHLEAFKQAQFPELQHVPVYLKSPERDGPKITQAEGELVRRTGRPSQKQTLTQTLQALFATSHTQAELRQALSSLNLHLYQRGKNWGLENTQTGKKYRLTTLGVADQWANLLQAPEQTPPTPPVSSADDRASRLLQQRAQMEQVAQQQIEEVGQYLEREDRS